MRNIILIIAFLLLGVTTFAQNKEGSIGKDRTYKDFSFTDADTINESETYYIEVSNFQSNPQMQDIWIDIDSASGDPNVTITVYGKKFEDDTYASIGTAVTWAGTSSDTAFNYTVATANRYRYLKIEFAASATDQQSLLSDVIVKTWNTGGQLTSTSITDGTATITSGAGSGFTTFDMSGALTVGGVVSIGGWGYTGEHIVLPETSSNTNAGSGIYSMVDYSATADKVFAGTYSRMLAMTTNQANSSTMVGAESQFRLRDIDIANGVHAGLWAYAEQSGTSELSGTGTFNAISATVESGVNFTVGASNNISCIIADGSINSGASGTIDASAKYAGLYIKSNGLDFYYGIDINGVDDDIKFQNGEILTNSLDKNLITNGNIIKQCPTPTAINSTDNITAAQMLGGVITSTSGAATNLTTPTATAIMALIPSGGRGTTFDLIIDNSAGSSTVTLVLDGSISVNTPAITGGDALTVSTANAVGLFRFYFVSATAAKVFRIY